MQITQHWSITMRGRPACDWIELNCMYLFNDPPPPPPQLLPNPSTPIFNRYLFTWSKVITTFFTLTLFKSRGSYRPAADIISDESTCLCGMRTRLHEAALIRLHLANHEAGMTLKEEVPIFSWTLTVFNLNFYFIFIFIFSWLFGKAVFGRDDSAIWIRGLVYFWVWFMYFVFYSIFHSLHLVAFGTGSCAYWDFAELACYFCWLPSHHVPSPLCYATPKLK